MATLFAANRFAGCLATDYLFDDICSVLHASGWIPTSGKNWKNRIGQDLFKVLIITLFG